MREGEHLRDALVYDESSPTFLRWAVDRRGGKDGCMVKAAAGDVAGIRTGGRPEVRYQYELYLISRVVWYLHSGPIPDGWVVDHRDGDITNNRISNLRAVTEVINRQNSRARSDNSSGICGVNWNVAKGGREYWRAVWREDGKTRQRCFSVADLGSEAAKKLAAQFRNKKIEELNQRGASYTERHGK